VGTFQYFDLCHFLSLSPSVTVNLGGVYHCPSHDTFNEVVAIAWSPNAQPFVDHSWYDSGHRLRFGELTADGWTCLESYNIVDTTASVAVFDTNDGEFWLIQANHIFAALQISSDFQDYVVSSGVHFELTISASEGDTPQGFLFLCPPNHFQSGPSSFKWPNCPAYWSLNQSGAEPLALEEANSLGFPSLRLSTRIVGRSWDASVYDGLRRFHKAKGFDPDSQDVAWHLRHKLYQVSG
ncbi:hypothetical protein C8R45DRAFT_878558, partial [Mycena sanguinolenta]